jgi:hypothetical protein
MLAEVVFVTRFLALVSGRTPVTLQADSSVRSIEIRRNDVPLVTLTNPPWSTSIDLGPDIAPQVLTAIGRDAHGNEVGRDMQVLNLARPLAEVSILVDRSGDEWTARITSTHLLSKTRTSTVVMLDGKTIRRGNAVEDVFLGSLDDRKIHSVRAEVDYEDRTKARTEVVFGGIYTEQMPAELTSVAMRLHGDGGAGCLTFNERPVVPNALERGSAEVFFVILPGAVRERNRLRSWSISPARFLIPDTDLLVVSPVSRKLATSEELDTDLFSQTVETGRWGTFQVVTSNRRFAGPVRAADAVAASGVRALAHGLRRAVVLVIAKGDEQMDASTQSASAVRRYLHRIGVPLYIWSIDGRNPEVEAAWGSATDISSAQKLRAATQELENDLDTQRIAWLPLAPIDALSVTSARDCSMTPLFAK